MKHFKSVLFFVGYLGFLFLAVAYVVKGESVTPEKPAQKVEITAAQREQILRSRLKVTETLSQINEIKVQTQKRVEELQQQSSQEFRQYQALVDQASKACKADETFDPDAIACKPKVQAKAKAEK